jgi:hypothetical protein
MADGNAYETECFVVDELHGKQAVTRLLKNIGWKKTIKIMGIIFTNFVTNKTG